MILIKNGYVIDPKSGTEGRRDILIEGEQIRRIVNAGEDVCISSDADRSDVDSAGISGRPEVDKDLSAGIPEGSGIDGDVCVIDASGCIVAPGLVDVHVHFRDPGLTQKEDILTGAAAAAKGGFTTVIMMANTRPTIDNAETLKYCLEKGEKTGIHVKACANVTCGMKGKELTDMRELAKAGAAGFTDDGVPIRDQEIVRKAMEMARELGLPISFHEEDPDYIDQNGINHGKASAYYGNGGSDRMAEITMVERDLEIALKTGAEIDIQHISTREAVDLVRQAKKKGHNIHAEATPHHFTLTEEACIRYGSYAKMNPPLREEEDRMAVVQGLADGTIDMIATDHAPHTAAEKKGTDITAAPSGIIGLETALALGVTELVDKGYLTMCELMTRMSYAPAQLYKLDAGYIAEGGPADLVIFNPNETFIAGDYASKAENTPFTGWKLKGRVEKTICGGRVVYEREMDHNLKRLDRKVVYPGTVLNFCEDTMQLPTGRVEKWDFLEHKKGGGACVVPVLPDGRILMIRQYRPAVDRETLELPAGAQDAEDADTSVTAKRELEEETGYTGEEITLLVRIQTAVAYCNEYTDIYLAENLQPVGGQQLDEAEEIKAEAFDKDELLRRIYAGEIRDAKTVAGIMAYAVKCR